MALLTVAFLSSKRKRELTATGSYGTAGKVALRGRVLTTHDSADAALPRVPLRRRKSHPVCGRASE